MASTAGSSISNQQPQKPTLSSGHSHPLQLLSDAEIHSASNILLNHVRKEDEKSGRVTKVDFKNISIHDPPKALLLPHLDAEAAGIALDQRPFVPRCVS